MTYAAGALTKVLVGASTANLSSAAATGGTGPYTYQWYRSTTNGFSPGAGSLIAGATGLSLADSGLIPGTTYYYVVVATDTGNSNTTANSSQLTVGTQPSLLPNQFQQSPLLGIVDLKLGSTNVIACQAAVGNTSNIFAGQGVKIVAGTSGGLPQVAPISSKSDACFGFARFNQKDIQYQPGQLLEVAMWGSVIWLYATGSVTQFAEVCVDPTYIGGVQATGNTATYVGIALDGSSGAGLIRVMLYPNITFATA